MDRNSHQIFEFGPFHLDTEERLLLRNGQRVALTPKVFETLIALVEHRGRLVQKDELIKLVWPDSFVEESNLTNNISSLRKALSDGESGASYIETIPRVGYRFNAQVRELPRLVRDLIVEKHSLTRIETEEIETDAVNPTTVVAPLVHLEQSGLLPRSKTAQIVTAVAIVFVIATAIIGYRIYSSRAPGAASIKSIAVLPFTNESGNPDMDYLSDGMTESLINSMSQLPQLSVKARSTVFRYKNQPANAQRIASELSVQAIVEGRLVQHGDDLTLYLALVDGRNGDQIWGEQYHRKLNDLIALQSEIARDVSHKLRARLSGTEEQKLAKNYTENTEAYQLYLRGRFHVLKLTRSEIGAGISYYRQAIEVDPRYALAYVGLAEAYRAFTLNGEMPAAEFLPQAKAAAQRAIEIDDRLGQAHGQLGFIIFWYDHDWTEAERQYQRALELDPNEPDTHQFYANLCLVTGRHEQALTEVKRASELDPLNVRISAIEAQLMIYTGKTDEALAKLQKTFDVDPNFFFAHMFAASAYIEKGMYAEAIAEARKAKETSGSSTYPSAFLGYALAKAGRQAEARAELEALLKKAKERYVHPYNIALIYNGLDDSNDALVWLERGFQQHEPRMVFLKAEPKWKNLSGDPRFQDLLRRMRLDS